MDGLKQVFTAYAVGRWRAWSVKPNRAELVAVAVVGGVVSVLAVGVVVLSLVA